MSSDPNLMRALRGYKQRIGQTEVKEVPFAPIGCRVFNDANISINNAAGTALTYNSEDYDSEGMHSTSSNTGRIIFTKNGYYEVYAQNAFASNSTGYRQAFIRKNGSTVIAQDVKNAVNGEITTLFCYTEYAFVVGDYIECIVFQNSGGALNITAATAYTPIFGARSTLLT